MSALKKNISTLSILALVFLCSPALVLASGFESVIWNIVQNFFGFFMGLAGTLLDVSLKLFVVGFGDQFLSKGAGLVVDALWVNVRDIFNITFIFGLVYIGFKMILNSDDSNTRRWLVSLILAALLVNFSLFITKFIVDFSNILATQILNGGFTGTDVSRYFMDKLGATTLWSDGVPEKGAWGYIFGAMIVFIVGTFVFAAGAMMLIIRYAALCLYMVMSPLMFLGWVFPGLQSVTSSYWKGFLGRAFFAPVYILLLYFSYEIVAKFSAAGNPDFKNMLTSGGQGVADSFQTTLPPFILASIFMIASVVVANKLGADGAGAAIKIGSQLSRKGQRMATGMAGGATVGAAGRLGRNTAGRYANHLVNSDKWKSDASKSTWGKLKYQAAGGVAKSSFDARRVAGLGAATGLGTGVAGGYAQSLKDKKEKEEKFAEGLGKNETRDEDGNIKNEFKGDIERNEKDLKEKYQPYVKAKNDYHETKTKTDAARLNLDNKKTEAEAEKLSAIATNKQKITQLEEQLKRAEGDGNQQNDIRKQIDIEKQEIASKEAASDNKFKSELDQMSKIADDAGKEMKAAEANVAKQLKEVKARAESQVTYARQLDYIKQLESTAAFWNKPFVLASNALGGTIGGSTIAGATGAVGAAGIAATGVAGTALGLSATSAHSARTKEAASQLSKRWGSHGQNEAKREGKKKDYELLAQVQKELGIETNPAPATNPEPNEE